MREVEVSRFVQATPREVRRLLTPGRLVEYEGSFTVRSVDETERGVIVTAGARGLQLALRFEERDGGLYYEQEGENGPFESMETWVEIAPENEGARLTMRSRVDISLPLPFSDRIAAWKRRGELKRALRAIARDL